MNLFTDFMIKKDTSHFFSELTVLLFKTNNSAEQSETIALADPLGRGFSRIIICPFLGMTVLYYE